MKGAGWVGIVLIAVGALLIWAGYSGYSLLEVIRSVLQNEPLPARADAVPEATPGGSGKSGFVEDNAGAGQGASGGGGGGW